MSAPFAVLIPLCIALPPVTAGDPSPVDFNRDVRPILSDRCFPCHGPDSGNRKADLRLDRFDDAIAPRSGLPAIAPGDPTRSELVARITAGDPAERMPPEGMRKALSAAEVDVLVRWVAEGARYAEHWSFVPPPATVDVPKARDASWVENPIDAFVLARLETEELAPSPAAELETLLRRVSFDLTGLPPSPDEIDAFVAAAGEDRDAAYGRAVDRLLASPRYAERMAQSWLDLARYADSYGYQSDQLNTLWPWRDFVVDAFDRNLQYDRFVTWQLAGDLLPEATREQRLATAFNRLHRMTNEGGSIHEEYRVEGVADRVNTLGTAMLGLTIECARCHDHKFDPITAVDYYSLFACFDDVLEEGTYEATSITPTPSLLLPTPEQEVVLTARRDAVDAARAALDAARDGCGPRFEAWVSGLPSGNPLPRPADHAVVRARFDGEAESVAIALGSSQPVAGRRRGERPDPAQGGGEVDLARRLDGDEAVAFDVASLDPALGDRHVAFTIAFALKLAPETPREPVVVACRSGGTDAGYHGADLMLRDHRLEARLYRHWPGNALAVRAKEPLPLARWIDLAWSYDGSDRAAGLAIFADGRKLDVEIVHDRVWKSTEPHGPYGGAFAFGARFRDRGAKDACIDDIAAFPRALSTLEVMELHARGALESAVAARGVGGLLRDHFESAIDPACRDAAAALRAAVRDLVEAESPVLEAPVMEESAARPMHVLRRGRYDDPDGDRPVAPGAPERLRRGGPEDIEDRLALARWLTSPDHPLTARVAVNRLFAQCFGRGIVATMEDFGAQGAMPSHPELLDWLARDFVDHGFDVKRTLRLLVTSATYAQASRLTPELLARDPDNRLLARGPSKRLTAEMLRDAALLASGLLVETRGGPPVSPYQPANFWTEANSMSPAYRQSTGADLHRRSLYSVWKRTAPLPNLTLFDAPSREVCVPRRPRTNTPLQALVLLNDVQFVEAARVLGERMLRDASTPADRIALGFRRLASRSPTATELAALTSLVDESLARFAVAPDDAAKLIAFGETKSDPDLSPTEIAAYATVAQAILNLDAVITCR